MEVKDGKKAEAEREARFDEESLKTAIAGKASGVDTLEQLFLVLDQRRMGSCISRNVRVVLQAEGALNSANVNKSYWKVIVITTICGFLLGSVILSLVYILHRKNKHLYTLLKRNFDK